MDQLIIQVTDAELVWYTCEELSQEAMRQFARSVMGECEEHIDDAQVRLDYGATELQQLLDARPLRRLDGKIMVNFEFEMQASLDESERQFFIALIGGARTLLTSLTQGLLGKYQPRGENWKRPAARILGVHEWKIRRALYTVNI